MGKVVFDDLISSIDALTVMLQLVGRLYKFPPDTEIIEYLEKIDLEDKEDLFLTDEECRAGLGLMSSFCRDLAMDEAVRRVTGDHSGLFVGPLHLPSPPWSSVYMDGGSLFGPTALAVEKEFKRLGFWIPEGNHEPCDHIAYELQLVAELNKKAAEKLREGDEAGGSQFLNDARQFINTYLSPWLPDFLGRVEEHAETGFYDGLAKLTRGLVQMESGFLDGLAHQEAGDIKSESWLGSLSNC
jgi:TorA maturation chaperone TorD